MNPFAKGAKAPAMLNGSSHDIMKENMKTMKRAGKTELEATKAAIVKGHPNRHKNLGAFLHKGKKAK